ADVRTTPEVLEGLRNRVQALSTGQGETSCRRLAEEAFLADANRPCKQSYSMSSLASIADFHHLSFTSHAGFLSASAAASKARGDRDGGPHHRAGDPSGAAAWPSPPSAAGTQHLPANHAFASASPTQIALLRPSKPPAPDVWA